METYYSPTEGSLETRLLYGCSLQFLLELGWFVSQGGNLSSAYTREPPGKLKTKHVDFPALPQKFQLLVTGLGSQWSTAGAGGRRGWQSLQVLGGNRGNRAGFVWGQGWGDTVANKILLCPRKSLCNSRRERKQCCYSVVTDKH